MIEAKLLPWAAPILSALMLVGIWILIPKVRTIVDERLAAFKKDFDDFEKTAHAEILDAVRELKHSFEVHNGDQYAHPNHLIATRVEAKLEEVKVELVKIQVVLEGWRRSGTTRKQACQKRSA